MYEILKADDHMTLVEMVNNLLQQGYMPQGGVATMQFNGSTRFFQAMYCAQHD